MGTVERPVPVHGSEKIGTAALARHQNVHVGEDEKIRQRLSGDDDQRYARDFAETPVRVHPDARDDEHGEDTGEERHDGEEYEAQDIPAGPGWIGRGSGWAVRRVSVGHRKSNIAMTTGSCRAALGLDGRGRPSPHGPGWIFGQIVRRKVHANSPVPVASTLFDELFFPGPFFV